MKLLGLHKVHAVLLSSPLLPTFQFNQMLTLKETEVDLREITYNATVMRKKWLQGKYTSAESCAGMWLAFCPYVYCTR